MKKIILPLKTLLLFVLIFFSGQINAQSIDSDGDGITDEIDVDDDNDGILDTVECNFCTETSDQFTNGGFELPVIPATSYFLSQSVPGWSTTASDRYIEIWSNGFLGYNAAEGNQFVELNANEVSTLYQTFCIPKGGGVLNWSVKHRGRDTAFIPDVAEVRIGASFTNYTVVATMSDTSVAWGTYSGQLTLPANNSDTYYIMFASISSASGNPGVGNFLDDVKISFTSNCTDTDGDGIPDSLDLDSDNDGCLDAMEGGANISYAQLVAAQNGLSVGTGSTASNQNLCGTPSCVSTSGPNIGLPQFAIPPIGYSNSTGQTIGDSENSSLISCFCYAPIANTGIVLDTNHGITALGRAGADNSNWPMVRKGAWTALEAKTKGFVVNRLTAAQIAALPSANLREGMMVYNVTQDCLQINIDGTATGWKCYNTQTCPEVKPSFQLSCSSATFSPTTMVSGISYTGTLTLPYTNGDASAYTSGSAISSTGVTGLTATLRAGTLANGAGNLVYDVTGTPSSSGTATFPVTFNGKSCNINVVVNDELSSNSIFINVDQESFYSGGIGLYSTFAVDFYGLPGTYNGSDYNITVNGITIKRSELYAGFRFYPLSCISQPGNTCLRSGTYTAVLPNGKELSVSVTAPSQAPPMPSGSNSSRRQVCTDNGPDLPTAPYDGVCNNYNVN